MEIQQVCFWCIFKTFIQSKKTEIILKISEIFKNSKRDKKIAKS